MNQTNETSLWDLPTTRSTSRRARREMGPRVGSVKHRILTAIAASGTAGLSDDEGETLLQVRCCTYTPRRLELLRAGLIADSGLRRATGSGCPAVVWIVSQAGLRVLREVTAQ